MADQEAALQLEPHGLPRSRLLRGSLCLQQVLLVAVMPIEMEFTFLKGKYRKALKDFLAVVTQDASLSAAWLLLTRMFLTKMHDYPRAIVTATGAITAHAFVVKVNSSPRGDPSDKSERVTYLATKKLAMGSEMGVSQMGGATRIALYFRAEAYHRMTKTDKVLKV